MTENSPSSYDLPENSEEISLEFLEKVTGMSKTVIQRELGITSEKINLQEFKQKIQKFAADLFNF